MSDDTPNTARAPLTILLDMMKGGEWTYARVQKQFGCSYTQARRYIRHLDDVVGLEHDERGQGHKKVFRLPPDSVFVEPSILADADQLDLFGDGDE